MTSPARATRGWRSASAARRPAASSGRDRGRREEVAQLGGDELGALLGRKVAAVLEDGVFVFEVSNDGVSAHRRGGAPGMGLRLAALEALQAGGVVEFGERENGHWRVRLAVPEAP